MAPFEILGSVYCSRFIATMALSLAISKMFSVKKSHDIEIWVWGSSRSQRNNNVNVYGAVILAEPLREFTRFI